MFTAVTEVIGQPELQKDERFATPGARAGNAAAVTEILEGWARSRSKHEVMNALAAAVPSSAPLRLLAKPHLRERGVVYDIDHPTRGRFSVIGCPVRRSDSAFRLCAEGEVVKEGRIDP